MVIYSANKEKASVRSNGRFFVVKTHTDIDIDIGISDIKFGTYLGVDDGTYVLFEPVGKLQYPLQLLTKSFYHIGELELTVVNNTGSVVTIKAGSDLIQCIPLSTAYYSQIEMQQVNEDVFKTKERIVLG